MDQCPGLGGSVPVDLRDSVAQRRCLWQTKIMHQRFSGDITDEKLNNRRFYQKVEETPTHVSGAQSLQIASKRIPKKNGFHSIFHLCHWPPSTTRDSHLAYLPARAKELLPRRHQAKNDQQLHRPDRPHRAMNYDSHLIEKEWVTSSFKLHFTQCFPWLLITSIPFCHSHVVLREWLSQNTHMKGTACNWVHKDSAEVLVEPVIHQATRFWMERDDFLEFDQRLILNIYVLVVLAAVVVVVAVVLSLQCGCRAVTTLL